MRQAGGAQERGPEMGPQGAAVAKEGSTSATGRRAVAWEKLELGGLRRGFPRPVVHSVEWHDGNEDRGRGLFPAGGDQDKQTAACQREWWGQMPDGRDSRKDGA